MEEVLFGDRPSFNFDIPVTFEVLHINDSYRFLEIALKVESLEEAGVPN